MKDLYDIYHDWTLVMASYNYGPGNVNKALQRAGANASTYWDIYPFLPKATRDYVPAFVALVYLYYYHSDYGVVPFASPLPLATDTVMVSRRIDLNRVSENELAVRMVKLLNPQYKQDVIPATVKSYPAGAAAAGGLSFYRVRAGASCAGRHVAGRYRFGRTTDSVRRFIATRRFERRRLFRPRSVDL